MAFWEYAGEIGKALDATRRPFVVNAPRLVFPALGIDRLTYGVTLAKLVPGSELIPQEGQVLSLYRQGVRFFRGTVVRPDQGEFNAGVTVEGPWAWMEKEPLSSAVTLDAASGGGTGARATYGFPMQSMSTSIGALLARMTSLGAPFTVGTVATTFACIPVTLNNRSFGQALVECLRLIGDMTAWFDYSGSALPVLNITRRLSGLGAGTCPTVTLDAGNFTAGQWKITPADEMRVAQVRVPFLDRATNGQRRYQEQKAGTAEAGHVLLLTASGEELDTFLPDEKLDSVQLQTLATNASDASWLAYLNGIDPVLSQLQQKYGAQWWGGNQVGYALGELALADADGIEYHNSPPASTTDPQVFHGVVKSFKVNGQPISGTKYVVTADASVPDWLKESGVTVEDGEMSVDVIVVIRHKSSGYVMPQGLVDFEGYSYYQRDGYDVYGSTSYPRIIIRAYAITRAVKFINVSYPALTTVYRQPDYAFIAPPANFAAGLLAARNWTPHTGRVTWAEQECGAARYLGKVVNVTGAQASFASMRAMVQSETLDIQTGTTTVELGPPARLAFSSLLDTTRPSSNKQIVYL